MVVFRRVTGFTTRFCQGSKKPLNILVESDLAQGELSSQREKE